MADGNSSPIDLFLPNNPHGVPDELYDQFDKIYNAIKILRAAVDTYAGNGVLDLSNYLSTVSPSFVQSIQTQKLQPIIVTASEAITAGQFVTLHNSTGLKVKRAIASGIATKAYGWAPADIANGASGVIFLTSGLNPALSGLTVAAIYYLSSTSPGGITTIRPTGIGTISQEVGVALSATELYVRLSPYQIIN